MANTKISLLIKLVLAFLTTSIFFGCSSVPSGSSNPEYLNQSYQGKSSSKEIKSDLIRSAKSVSAYPITGAYLEASIKEESKKEGLSENETRQKITELTQPLQNKTCFMVEISGSDTDRVNLKYWGATLFQDDKTFQPKFVNPNKSGYSVTQTHISSSTIPGYKNLPPTVHVNSYDTTTYYNSDLLCTTNDAKIDTLKPFSLHLQPRFKENLKTIKLSWDAPVTYYK